MNRRGFLKILGTAAAVTAAGIIVPELIVPSTRKIFLPPRAGWTLGAEPGLNVGDVLTFEGVYDDQLKIRKVKQFVVVDVRPDSKYPTLNGRFEEITRYDTTWTLPNGEEQQYGVEFEAPAPSTPAGEMFNDRTARELLQHKARLLKAKPGATYFNLQLPTHAKEARWI
jgi:hypothetical protein